MLATTSLKKQIPSSSSNTIVSMAFAMLFSSVPVMGAVTAYSTDLGTFNTAQNNAGWNVSLYNGGGPGGDELSTFDGTTTTITQHDGWYQGGNDLEVDKTWMTVTLAYDSLADTVTVSFGDIFSLQTINRAFPSPIVVIDTGEFSTIWLGLNSEVLDSNLKMRTFNSTFGGEFVPELHVAGTQSSQQYFATGSESWNLSLTVEMEREDGLPTSYGPSQAELHIFGDNALDSIPEPSSTALIGIAGIFLMFRRRKM